MLDREPWMPGNVYIYDEVASYREKKEDVKKLGFDPVVFDCEPPVWEYKRKVESAAFNANYYIKHILLRSKRK